MTKQLLTGSFVALISPMNQDYSLDFGGFRTLIEFQREHGSSGVLIMGSSGEVSTLSTEERHAIVRETMKQKQPSMEMWYGCTGPTTEATIDYVKQAAAEGADGAMIAAPAYICASNDDIVDYFLEVADAATIPLGVYNNPPRVKTDLGADEVLRIAAHPNVQLLKESTGRVAQAALIARARPHMSLMCCCSPNLGLIVPTMSLGGHGTANMTGNHSPGNDRDLQTVGGFSGCGKLPGRLPGQPAHAALRLFRHQPGAHEIPHGRPWPAGRAVAEAAKAPEWRRPATGPGRRP